MSITLKSVSLELGKKQLLNDINLVITPGELTLLIGPNGAGKSTLLKVCAGDMAPTAGVAKLNQQELGYYSPQQLSSRRAVMTQDYRMSFSFTVGEIVTMGCYIYEGVLCRQKQQEIVREVMAFMNIEPLAERQFTSLSGGEQQRTQLARVLVQLWYPLQSEPSYLFLDEPTSSLDIFYQYQILSLAKQLSERNIGVLAVIHDLSLAACFGDQLVLLSQGRIMTAGTPQEVLQQDYLLSVYGIGGRYFQPATEFKPSVLIDNI